jgi:hypothetical protein
MNRNSLFLCSKTGIKVYLKPEFNPILKGTNLLHPDFTRKAKELFSKNTGVVKGLPRICSEHSEDALTWRYFSPLLEMTKEERGHWLQVFLEETYRTRPNLNVAESLAEAEAMFWRGRKVSPFYEPPPNLGYAEGNTEVDLSIQSPKAMIFVEAKYHSEIALHTSHSNSRDQIIRNIDVGTYYSWKRGMDFYFILLAPLKSWKSIERLNLYRENPNKIVDRLPHRSDIRSKLKQLTANLGFITWETLDNMTSERPNCRRT